MVGSLIIEGYWLMLSVVELFLTGDLGDWVVDLDPQGSEVKKLTRSILEGSNSKQHLADPDQRSLGLGKKDTLIGKEKDLVIGEVGIGIGGRNHRNGHMIGHEIRISEKIDTTIEIVIEIEKERGRRKETMVVIVIVNAIVIVIKAVIEVAIESEKETSTGILSAALVTVIARGITHESGRGIETMSVLVMIRIVVMLMKEMQTMIMLMWHMNKIVKVLK